MFPMNSEPLISISDFWCLFCLCLRVSVILPTCSGYPQQKRDYSALHPQAWTCIYTGHACRHLPSAVPWISKDHLLVNVRFIPKWAYETEISECVIHPEVSLWNCEISDCAIHPEVSLWNCKVNECVIHPEVITVQLIGHTNPETHWLC